MLVFILNRFVWFIFGLCVIFVEIRIIFVFFSVGVGFLFV